MTQFRTITLFMLLSCAAFAATGGRFVIIDPGSLEAASLSLTNNPATARAWKTVFIEANKALAAPLTTVMDKQAVPPSGDKHDYMSLSPYWWPNPDTPDGLPYVWRDGKNNPDRANYDLPALETMAFSVRALATAYYFSRDARFAENAARRLKTWFLDPATRMNPNLTFAQFRPGHDDAASIIETTRWRWLPDASVLLLGSPHWTEADDAALRRWFHEFATWFVTSPQGKQEAASPNNHGSWHAAQAVQYFLFAGDEEAARKILATIPARIADQILADGSQPYEVVRTRSFHYSVYNLAGLLDLARYGRKLDIDLAGYRTADGRSIRTALDHLIPYALGKAEWPHAQIRAYDWSGFADLLRVAGIVYQSSEFEELRKQLPNDGTMSPWTTLFEAAPRLPKAQVSPKNP